MEYIEDNYQGIKDQVELNDQIFQICDKFDLPSREDKQSRFIDEIYQLMINLNNAIYDTKDKADKRKDNMKKKILKKIPKLNSRVDEFQVKIENQKFLKIEDANIPEFLVELKDLELEFSEIAQKKKKIQIYQSTMDMGALEPFNNVDDVAVVLSYRSKLWNSIFEYQLFHFKVTIW